MVEQSYLYRNNNHVANQNNARLSGKLCDVTIKVNDKEYRAHKIILASNLKYFESMFLSSFQESKQDVVILQDVEETYLEEIISFAYTGEILLTDTNALSLLELANYFGEDGVKESCIEFLKTHLKKEVACRAFMFATSIGCISLKNAANQSILSNFGDCLLTTEFLDFDFESLRHILSNQSLHSVGPRELFLEGLLKWISHDSKNRRTYINDLLELIEITKLSSGYLLKWLCKTIKDQCDIVKDVMLFFDEKIQQTDHIKDLKQEFKIIGFTNSKLCLQQYDSINKKWSDLDEIMSYSDNDIGLGMILNNSFYFVTKESSNFHLYVFDPTTKKSTTLLAENRLTSCSSRCTCSRFLYFCGGYPGAQTNQVVRYDPLTHIFDTLPPMNNKRSSAAAIFYQGYLHVLGGMYASTQLNSVEKYDTQSKLWVAFPSMCEERYAPAVAVLGGKLYACGGKNSRSVEVYDPTKNNWQLVANMNKVRYWFLVIALEDKLLAIGGKDELTVEVYDPKKDNWQIDPELSSNLKIEYPQGRLL